MKDQVITRILENPTIGKLTLSNTEFCELIDELYPINNTTVRYFVVNHVWLFDSYIEKHYFEKVDTVKNDDNLIERNRLKKLGTIIMYGPINPISIVKGL